jgi:hypothetical protein
VFWPEGGVMSQKFGAKGGNPKSKATRKEEKKQISEQLNKETKKS